jgi:ferredoxin--NADP+ reductase
MADSRQHFVAVIGGAVSGSVAAELLAEHGVLVAVFEQNARPYGKIEDGLPLWHVEQRKQEYAKIDARMKKPGVYFIPSTRLGRDLPFDELHEKWGFSAVILANGAWRDRDLGIPGAEKFIDNGLLYQNPFIYWYNHKNEKGYIGPRYETPDEALVVGGGLASIDVVKVLQIENYQRALRARGVDVGMHELEKGIPVVCKAHGVKPEDLGVKGCLLIYRRREQDMPLAQPPDGATPEQVAKTEQVRLKMLRLAQQRYLFRIKDRRVATGLVVENGELVGLKLAETKVEGRKAEPIPGSEYELRAPLVISSIGSVPEMIAGVAMKGEYYTFTEEELPRYSGAQRVYGVGNVVTGQGNIRVSLVHSQKVTSHLVENYIKRAADGHVFPGADMPSIYATAEEKAAALAKGIEERVNSLPSLTASEVTAIEQRIRAIQERVGYTSDYDSWIAKVTPADLE